MKKIIFLWILMLPVLTSSAQSTESEIQKEAYLSDPYISIILNYIPEGWTFTATDTTFIFRSTDSIWVLDENRINAPLEDKQTQIKRIMTYGKKQPVELILRYETRWTVDQVQQARIMNAWLSTEMQKLPEKYKITALRDPKLSMKDGDTYIATTPEEQKRINAYQAEKEHMMSQRINLPDFHTIGYSMFVVSKTGVMDEMHLIYPEKLSLQMYTLLNTIGDVCGK